jgi:hypothetical protein
MAAALMLPAPYTPERNRMLSVNALRLRALERLYERREAVDNLIRSLEEYQAADSPKPAPVVAFTSAKRYWSSSAQ